MLPALALSSLLLSSVEQVCDIAEDNEIALIASDPRSRADCIPIKSLENKSDTYLEGYIQALVDMNYYEYKVVAKFSKGHVILCNLPKNELMANSIIAFVKEIPEVKSIETEEITAQVEDQPDNFEPPKMKGVWFPQTYVLFQPLVADPRDPSINIVAYRFGDRVIGRTCAAVTVAEDFPIYRWKDVFKWSGDLQIDIQGAVFAVFNYCNLPKTKSGDFSELVNADYMFCIPITYAFDKWSFRTRIYHISSHLGDEFICNNPEYVYLRVNPSYEAIDSFFSYQFSQSLRFYGGPGVIVHSDKTFKMKPLYVQYGVEVRLLGQKMLNQGLYGTPYLACHVDNYQQHHWNMDLTICMGYEFSKLQGVGRRARVFLEYHQGYSWEGQFFNERTRYGEIGFSWGF
jgi:Protein of unknown function (DUF1207)